MNLDRSKLGTLPDPLEYTGGYHLLSQMPRDSQTASASKSIVAPKHPSFPTSSSRVTLLDVAAGRAFAGHRSLVLRNVPVAVIRESCGQFLKDTKKICLPKKS
jgi:hypothetical protein